MHLEHGPRGQRSVKGIFQVGEPGDNIQDECFVPYEKKIKNLQETLRFDMQDSKPGGSVYNFVLKLLRHTSVI